MSKMLEPVPVTRRRRIHPGQRSALAAMVEGARLARGWSAAQLAQVATNRLARTAPRLERGGMVPTLVTWRHVSVLENGTFTYPLGNATRRARLLGIALALELDLGEVNLIAGGI